MEINWTVDRNEKYEILNGDRNMAVRIKATPQGRYLWSYGRAFDHEDTLADAKEMVEGLYIGHGNPSEQVLVND